VQGPELDLERRHARDLKDLLSAELQAVRIGRLARSRRFEIAVSQGAAKPRDRVMTGGPLRASDPYAAAESHLAGRKPDRGAAADAVLPHTGAIDVSYMAI